MEAKLQKKIIDWLKINGVYVVKTRVLPGVPVGCPDIIGLYQDKWIAIEVKAASNSKFQPGQKYTLDMLKKGNTFVYVCHPENWDLIKTEIVQQFF